MYDLYSGYLHAVYYEVNTALVCADIGHCVSVTAISGTVDAGELCITTTKGPLDGKVPVFVVHQRTRMSAPGLPGGNRIA